MNYCIDANVFITVWHTTYPSKIRATIKLVAGQFISKQWHERCNRHHLQWRLPKFLTARILARIAT